MLSTQACFFKDQIGKDDIEGVEERISRTQDCKREIRGFQKQPTLENLQELNAEQIKDYLDNNRGSLSQYEVSGLKYLVDHLEKHVDPCDADRRAESADKTSADKQSEIAEARKLQSLEGVPDRSFAANFASTSEAEQF